MAPSNATPSADGGSAKKAPKVNAYQEIGVTGLKRTSGIIQEEYLRDLAGQNGVRIFKEMRDNDAIIGGIIFAITMFLRKVEWRVEPFSDDKADQEAADFVRDCMDDMSQAWPDFIDEVLTMLVFGWSYFEIVYKKRNGLDVKEGSSKYTDGKIGWRKFAIRSQDTLHKWQFDDDGGIQAMIQQAPPEYDIVPIPIEKALLFRTSVHKNNPEGRSILRNAYRSWFYKKRVEETEGVGIERDLAGLPMVEVPAEYLSKAATADMKATVAAFRDLVRNVRRDEQEGIIFPVAFDEDGNKMFEFKLMAAGGSRTFDTSAVIERYDKRIAMVVLADFILLGQDAVGSYALSVSKTGMFQAALEAWMDSIASVLNTHAVPRLFKLNGMNTERLPQIEHDNVQAPTLEELGAFLSSLTGSGAGVFPDTELENVLRRRAGLPEKEDKDQDDIEEQNERKGTDVSTETPGGKPANQQQPPPEEAPAEGEAQ